MRGRAAYRRAEAKAARSDSSSCSRGSLNRAPAIIDSKIVAACVFGLAKLLNSVQMDMPILGVSSL
jgi:hypothetical protein